MTSAPWVRTPHPPPVLRLPLGRLRRDFPLQSMIGPVPTIPTDDELELIRQSGVALRAGKLSLSAGTGSYRVKNTMERVATALGIDRHEAHVTLTEITTTSH